MQAKCNDNADSNDNLIHFLNNGNSKMFNYPSVVRRGLQVAVAIEFEQKLHEHTITHNALQTLKLILARDLTIFLIVASSQLTQEFLLEQMLNE